MELSTGLMTGGVEAQRESDGGQGPVKVLPVRLDEGSACYKRSHVQPLGR